MNETVDNALGGFEIHDGNTRQASSLRDKLIYIMAGYDESLNKKADRILAEMHAIAAPVKQVSEGELLPCPFCGGETDPWTEGAFHYGDRGYSPKKEHITCKGCGTRKTLMGDDFTKAEAFAAWNTRTTPTAPRTEPVRELVEAARDMLATNAEFDQFGITEGRRQAMRNLKAALTAYDSAATTGKGGV